MNAKYGVNLIIGQLCEVAGPEDAGVIYEDVDRAKGLQSCSDDAFSIGAVRHRCRARHRSPTHSFNLTYDLVGAVSVHIVYDDSRPSARQLERMCSSDT